MITDSIIVGQYRLILVNGKILPIHRVVDYRNIHPDLLQSLKTYQTLRPFWNL